MVKKAFRNALLIQIIAGIVGVIGMVVDGAVTGSCLGTDAMAAFGLASPVIMIFVACSSVCEMGTSLLIGRLVGARKMKEASDALSSCIIFVVILSLIITGLVFAFSNEIAAFLGANGNIADMTSDYLRGFSLCAPALFLMTVLMPVMQIDGKMKWVVFAVITMTLVNIVGDIVVGFVLKGGLFGMAFATTISYFAALALMLPSLIKKGGSMRLSLKHLSFEYVGNMICGGLPNALQQGCRSLLMLMLNTRLLAIADENAVAAFTAIMSAANLCMVIGSGIGTDVSMLTGVFAGEADDRAIRKLVRTALFTAIVYDAVLCVVLLLCASLIMPMFISDPAILALAVTGFRLYCLSMIGYSINVTLRLYYQAMRLFRLSYIYVFCNSFLFTILGAFLLSEIIGVNGIWLAFLFGETVTIIVLVVWVLAKTPKGGSIIDRLMFIPSEMTKDVITRFDSVADNQTSVTTVSEQVYSFCVNNDDDKRTAYLLSLSVEEIGNYFLKNNAGKGKRVEVRLLKKSTGWSMSIRDNGGKINPLDILREESRVGLTDILREEIPEAFSYIGIKLICKMAKKIEYLDTLNINSFNIEI